jgi:subtilisin family serine protease
MTQHRDAARGRRDAGALAAVVLAAVVLAAAGLVLLACGPARAGASAPATPPMAATPHMPATARELVPGPGEWWFGYWRLQQQVWPLTQGAGVTVAVLDTGVQASLPDLRGVVLRGGDVSDGSASGDGASGDTDGDTANDGHGTAVADLIAGQGYGTGIVGIAPRARILPVKVGDTGADSVAAAAAGIRFAVASGARVINMSFGGQVSTPRSCDPVLASAISYALAHDVVLVAAAGDTGVLPGPMQPASCAGVLAVAGVGPGGSLWPGSTREPYVAVAAPGEDITFAGLDGRHSVTATGTSFSSALVAGAAALIRSRYPHMPWYQVDQRLTGTAAAVGTRVRSEAYGYGVVDLAEAVNATAYPLPPAAAPAGSGPSRPAAARPAASRLAGARSTPVPARQARVALASATRSAAGITTPEAIAIGSGAVAGFAAALVLVLRRSSRRPRARRGRHTGPPRPAGPRYPAVPVNHDWERDTRSFGPSPGAAYQGAPAWTAPPGYRPAEPPYWPNGAGGSSDGWSR